MLRRGKGPLVVLLGLMVLTSAGCAGYDRNSERRTIGQTTDDLAIQAIVKTRLLDDAQVQGLAINTNVHLGVVTLYGRVESVELRDRAMNIAASVRGVTQVVDRLVVIAAP